jgi:hypothetical protein
MLAEAHNRVGRAPEVSYNEFVELGSGIAWTRMGTLLASMASAPLLFVGLNPYRHVGKCAVGPPVASGIAQLCAGLLLIAGCACVAHGLESLPPEAKAGWWVRFGAAASALALALPMALS